MALATAPLTWLPLIVPLRLPALLALATAPLTWLPLIVPVRLLALLALDTAPTIWLPLIWQVEQSVVAVDAVAAVPAELA